MWYLDVWICIIAWPIQDFRGQYWYLRIKNPIMIYQQVLFSLFSSVKAFWVCVFLKNCDQGIVPTVYSMFLNPKRSWKKKSDSLHWGLTQPKRLFWLPEMFVAKTPLHGDFALWVCWNDNRDGCASQLCQHFSRASASDYQQLWWYTSLIHYYTLTPIVFSWKWLLWPFYGKWK